MQVPSEPVPPLVSNPRKRVWLVIPCYNDAYRLGQFLPQLCEALAASPVSTLLQVVDDGSRPEEKQALSALIDETQKRYRNILPPLFQDVNQGKGAAILHGWEAAGATDYFGFLDADGAVSASETLRLLRLINAHPRPDATLFASRIKMRGRIVQRSTHRHLMGRIFASLVGALVDDGIYDSQCGFKLISASAYRLVKPVLQEKRFAFDVELLAALNHYKCPVEEIPVDWADIEGSKVSLVRDSLRMFFAIKQIQQRSRHWPQAT